MYVCMLCTHIFINMCTYIIYNAVCKTHAHRCVGTHEYTYINIHKLIQRASMHECTHTHTNKHKNNLQWYLLTLQVIWQTLLWATKCITWNICKNNQTWRNTYLQIFYYTEQGNKINGYTVCFREICHNSQERSLRYITSILTNTPTYKVQFLQR
jgi:hypothetical protein